MPGVRLCRVSAEPDSVNIFRFSFFLNSFKNNSWMSLGRRPSWLTAPPPSPPPCYARTPRGVRARLRPGWPPPQAKRRPAPFLSAPLRCLTSPPRAATTAAEPRRCCLCATEPCRCRQLLLRHLTHAAALPRRPPEFSAAVSPSPWTGTKRPGSPVFFVFLDSFFR